MQRNGVPLFIPVQDGISSVSGGFEEESVGMMGRGNVRLQLDKTKRES